MIELPALVDGWVALIVLVLVGIAAGFNIFDRTMRLRRKEADLVDNRLITNLQTEVEFLRNKAEEQGKELRDMKAKQAAIEAENVLLKDILQGRDKDTMEYQKKSLEAASTGLETHKIVVAMNSNMQNFARLMEEHLKRIEPVLAVRRTVKKRGR